MMRNKKMFIALITAAVLLMTGFVFADTLSDREGEFFGPGFGSRGFFGGMGGHHRRNVDREDWDREDFQGEGFRFGGPDHCFFLDGDGEERDFEEFREQWLENKYEIIDRGLKDGEITEEEALEYKEIMEERSRSFEEEGGFHRGPGRGRSRGHMW